jgi:hypothetical protein
MLNAITRAWTAAAVPSGNTTDIFRMALCVVEIQHSFPGFPALTAGRNASGYRQELLSDMICGVQLRDVPAGPLFVVERWKLERSSAQRGKLAECSTQELVSMESVC